MVDEDNNGQQDFGKPKNPDELREGIRKRSKKLDTEYLAQGMDLYIVKHCQHYLKWGYETFKAYVEAETGDSVKQAERYRKVWVTLVKELGVSQEDLVDIGFSKASLLCKSGVATKATIKSWIEKARKTPYRELDASTSRTHQAFKESMGRGTKKGKGGEGTGVSTTSKGEEESPTGEGGPNIMTFSLFPDQKDVVEEALNKAELIADSSKRGHLLTCIATDFLTGMVGTDKKENKRLKFHLRNLQQAFGVEIMALPKTDEAAEAISQFMKSRPDLFEPSLSEEEDDEDDEEDEYEEDEYEEDEYEEDEYEEEEYEEDEEEEL